MSYIAGGRDFEIKRKTIKRFPSNIVSLGEFAQSGRQQFIFAHPINEEHLDRSLGLMDIHVQGKRASSLDTQAHYSPVEIKANCGTEETTIYVGSTIVEVVPILDTMFPPVTEHATTEDLVKDKTPKTNNISAFVVMSGLQTRLLPITTPTDPTATDFDSIRNFQEMMTIGYDRSYFLSRARLLNGVDTFYTAGAGSDFHRLYLTPDTNTDSLEAKNMFTFMYRPSIYDGTVVFLSDNTGTDEAPTPDPNLPFGRNKVEISLGFATDKFSSSVPNHEMTALKDGGWLNPYETQAKYNLIMGETCANGGYKIDGCTDSPSKKTTNDDTQLINRVIHPKPAITTDNSTGYNMRTYPISDEAAELVRAVKFKFTLNQGTDKEQIITRVVRFKNTYLKKLADE